MSVLLNRYSLFHEHKCAINIDVLKLSQNPPLYVGPFVKMDSCLNGVWKGDILFVHHYKIDPMLNILDEHDVSDTEICERGIIATEFGYHFTKWDISVKQSAYNKRQNYAICYSRTHRLRDEQECADAETTKQFCFFVPGLTVPWRWAFFSCNDLSHTSGYKGYPEKYGGIVPLWADLVHKHHKYNYNLLVGLGDQVYLDEVFEHVKFLDQWCRIPNRQEREVMAVPEEVEFEISKWTFFYYLRHFAQPYFDQALATIPTLFVMSDHDTYDGQGSYPEELENSPVLSTTRKVLQKYYLLFQQHQDPCVYFNRIQGIDKTPLYGDTVTPCLKQMGEDLAILALDTRFERNRDEIISPATYDYIFKEMGNLLPTTTHLVVATEIPPLFPDIRKAERMLRKISNMKRSQTFANIFSRLSWFKTLGLPFGEPLLLTDMIDHWNSDAHIEERNRFIHRLQDFADRKNIRITFIGGDVHCCGIGKFSTPSKSRDKIRAHYENEMLLSKNFERDHRLMYVIISSAIANVPPPAYIIKAYHWLDKPEKIVDEQGNVTDGRMLRFFLRDTKGRMLGKKAKKLMGRRNWCSVEMSSIDDSFFFEWHVEMFLGAGKTMRYNIIVPRLD